MKCKICNEEITIRSIAMHLRWSHKIKTEEYISLYGEFRPKKIKERNIREISEIKCSICNKSMMHNRQLMFHITKEHKNISKGDYIVNYMLNGIHPLCKCGCGEKVKILPHGKNEKGEETYHVDYIKGHWDWVKPNWITHSHETKMKMRSIKTEQIKNKEYYYEKTSKQENEIYLFLKEYFGSIKQNDRKLLSGKELDVIIPEIKTAIEFNGMYYHSDKFKPKLYHLNKTRECELNDYRLIHIWEYDWKYNKEIIKSNLLNIVGKTQNKIHARKCIIKEISREETSKFLKENHIQGYALDKIRIGLFYDKELISIMTFSKLRKNIGGKSVDGSWELLRFCNKINTSVIGGASKLLKYFNINYKPLRIISYANRDWSKGNLYEKLGFNFIGYTSPGYFYSKSTIKYNRFQFRKDILIKQGFNPNKTEKEIMEERGYHKAWNTGNLKFEMNFKYNLE